MPFSGISLALNGNRKIGREFAHPCSASHKLMMQCLREIMQLPAYAEALHRNLNCSCTVPQIVHQKLPIT